MLLALLLGASEVAAACPNVQVAFKGDRWTEPLKRDVVQELDGEIARADLCTGDLATQVLLLWQGNEPMGIALDYRRDATELQLKRRVDPARIPEDGLPLTVAAVVGELLREAHAPERRVEPTPEPAAAAVDGEGEAAPRGDRFGVGVRVSGAGGSGALRGTGEVFGRVSFGRFAVQLALGGGGGSASAAPAGSVELRQLVVALSALARLLGSERWALSVELGLDGGPWWLTARANPGWSGGSASSWSIGARAGLELGVRVSALWLLLSGGAAVPFRALAVTDGATKLGNPAGVTAQLSLGAAFKW